MAVNSKGTLYIACLSANSVISVDSSGGVVVYASSTQCPNPNKVAISSSDQVLVTCQGQLNQGFNWVSGGGLIALTSNSFTAIGPSPCNAYAVAFQPNSNNFFLTCSQNFQIYKFTSPTSYASVYPPAVGGYGCNTAWLSAVGVSPDGSILYYGCIANGGGSVFAQNLTTGATQPLDSERWCFNAAELVVTPLGEVYVACFSNLLYISADRQQTVQISSASISYSIDLAINMLTSQVYAADQFTGIVAVGGRTALSVLTEFHIANTVLVHPTTGVVYGGSVSLQVFQVTSANTSTNLFTNCGAWDLALNPLTNFLFAVCRFYGYTLAATNLNTGAVVYQPSIPTSQCSFGVGVAVLNSKNLVYVSCSGYGVQSSQGSVSSTNAAFLNTATVPVIATDAQCPSAARMGVDQSLNLVYLTCQTGVFVWNANSNTLAGTSVFPTCVWAAAVAVDSASNVVALCVNGIFSLVNGVATTLDNTGKCPSAFGLTASLTQSKLFAAACQGGSVLLISGSLTSTTTTSFIPLTTSISCSAPSDASFDNANTFVYAACSSSGGAVSQADIVKVSISNLPSPCDAGYDFSSSGASSCSQCGVGTYRNYSMQLLGGLSSAAFCAPCSAGSVSPSLGSSSCSQCAAGRSYIGALACSDCAAGYYASVTSPQCSPCGAGSFSNVSGSSICALCGPGTYSAAAAPQCLPCPIGTFSGGSNTTACLNCPQGKFSNTTGLTQCYPCAPGQYQASAATTPVPACLACGPGSFSNTSGAFVCQSCAPGTFMSNSSATACAACVAGYSTTFSGAAQCSPCGPGTFANVTGAACSNCPVGFYAPLPGQSSCQACNAGMYQPSSYTPAPSCILCAPASGSSACQSCATGNFMPNSSATACVACALGYTSMFSGAAQCSPCSPGTFNNVSGAGCSNCPAGSRAPNAGQTMCQSCDPGSFQPSANSPAPSCIACAPGSFSNSSGSSSCAPCASGSFMPNSSATACAACPLGYSSTFSGSALCSPCGAGTFSNVSGSLCQNCPAGSHAVSGGQSLCQLCDFGSFQSSSSSPAPTCILCGPGKFSGSLGASACADCPVGRFSNTSGLSECLLCPEGQSSAGGAVECSGCSIGKFISNSSGVDSGSGSSSGSGSLSSVNGSQWACVNCPSGRFQPSSPAPTVCSLCDVGKFQQFNDTPAAACIPCPPGRAAASLGSSDCVACSVGRFSNDSGLSVCFECSAGFFQNSPNGALSCYPCNPGSFSNSTATGECSTCAAGSFAGLSGSTECLPCSAGSFAGMGGLSICQSCAPGDFNPTAGQTQCQPCPPGTFSPEYNATGCQLCIAGTFNNQNSSRICQSCSTGFYQLLPGSTTCLSCEGLDGVSCGQDQQISVLPGWYAITTQSPVTDASPSLPFGQQFQSSISTFQCGSATACIGGSIMAQCDPSRQPSTVGNPLCGQCAPGYSPWNDQCLPCETPNSGGLFALLLLCWVFVVGIHASSNDTDGLSNIFMYFIQSALLIAGSMRNWLQWLNVLSLQPNQVGGTAQNCFVDLNPYENLALGIIVSLIFFAFHTFNLLVHYCLHLCAVRLQQSNRAGGFAAAAHGGADVSSQYPSLKPQSAVRVSDSARPIPRLLRALFLNFSLAHYVRSYVLLSLFCYAQVTSACFQFLQCVSVDGATVVYSFPAVHCDSSEYAQLKVVVILLLVLYVAGLPVAFAGVIAFRDGRPLRETCGQWVAKCRGRQPKTRSERISLEFFTNPLNHTENHETQGEEKKTSYRAETSGAASTTSTPTQPPAIKRSQSRRAESVCHQAMSVLYAPFRSSSVFWCVVILVRRSILIALNTFLYQYPGDRQSSIVFFHSLCLLSTIYWKPFRTRGANALEYVSLSALMAIGVLLAAHPQPPFPNAEQALIFLIVLVFSVAFIVIFVAWRVVSAVFGNNLDAHAALTTTGGDGRSVSARVGEERGGASRTVALQRMRVWRSLGWLLTLLNKYFHLQIDSECQQSTDAKYNKQQPDVGQPTSALDDFPSRGSTVAPHALNIGAHSPLKSPSIQSAIELPVLQSPRTSTMVTPTEPALNVNDSATGVHLPQQRPVQLALQPPPLLQCSSDSASPSPSASAPPSPSRSALASPSVSVNRSPLQPEGVLPVPTTSPGQRNSTTAAVGFAPRSFSRPLQLTLQRLATSSSSSVSTSVVPPTATSVPVSVPSRAAPPPPPLPVSGVNSMR